MVRNGDLQRYLGERGAAKLHPYKEKNWEKWD